MSFNSYAPTLSQAAGTADDDCAEHFVHWASQPGSSQLDRPALKRPLRMAEETGDKRRA
jgi:hypothetical protein